MMKSSYVAAIAMSTSIFAGGVAHSADVAADTMTDSQKTALRKTVEWPQRVADLSELGGAAGALP
jgi:hypothetical protein